jgi:hypothetical protein
MMDGSKRWSWLAVVVLLALLGSAPMARPAQALTQQQSFPTGTVVGLQGTPHLWIAGDDGTLHWAGDTRALAARTVFWNTRVDLPIDRLRTYRTGDPYLSTGLLKIGEPIYLPKWEVGQATPTLFHIQSIPDVEIFGINADNYGRFVLDRDAWQARYGFNPDTLPRGELPPAVGPGPGPTATPAPGPTATPTARLDARLDSREQIGDGEFRYRFVLDSTVPRARLFARVDAEQWICSPDCTDTRRIQEERREIGQANDQGRLEWEHTHLAFKGSSFYFSDEFGNQVTVGVGDDL